MALDFLMEDDGKTTVFGPGEVQELIDHVTEQIGTRVPMEGRWAVEDAIADAFGFEQDDDRDLVRQQ